MLILAKTIGVLLAPPAIFLALIAGGLLLRGRSRVGIPLAWVGVLCLLALSLPVTAHFLLGTLQNRIPLPTVATERLRAHADAIVVLGGGRVRNAREYGGDTISDFTLERLRYAARLHRASGLPLLVTGGSPFGEPVSEADLMQRSLVEDFNLRANWTEGRSRNTYENATYTRAVLDAAGIRRIVLVTHAWHMARALAAFRTVGFEVIPAPTGYMNSQNVGVLSFLPSGAGLSENSRAISEWLGIFWYALRYGTGLPDSPIETGNRGSLPRLAVNGRN